MNSIIPTNLSISIHARQRLVERAQNCDIETLLETARPANSMDFAIFGAAHLTDCQYFVGFKDKQPIMMVFSPAGVLITVFEPKKFKKRW